jgi:transposase
VWRIALREQGRPTVPHDGGGAIPNPIEKEGMAVTILDTSRPVTGGVDTHLDVHVAAALDGIGGLLGVKEFETTATGHKALLGWLKSFGTPVRVGVEGTGSYGAGLARYLRRAGVEVAEVDRPNRQERRRKGKTDTVDAIEAARSAQADRQLGQAKTRDGHVEAIRALVVAKRSAKSSRIKTMNQIRHLGFTAPGGDPPVPTRTFPQDAAQEGGRHAAPGRLRPGHLGHQDGASHPGPAGPGARGGDGPDRRAARPVDS